MSALLAVGDAIDRVPGWDRRQVLVRQLHGGLTNRAYKVTQRGSDFVMRLDATHTGAFRLDRRLEARIHGNAAAAGLSPRVVFADPAAGILVSEFLHGVPWTRESLDDHGNLEALAELLRRVHDLPLSGTQLNALAVANHYARQLGSGRGLYAFAARCVDVVARIQAEGRLCCCHNDVIAQNIIASPSLKLVDWEYACDNEPLFDLASLIGYHDLGIELAGKLLDAYSGGKDGDLRERLGSQLRVYDALHWLWLANRQALTHDRGLAARLDELQRRIA